MTALDRVERMLHLIGGRFVPTSRQGRALAVSRTRREIKARHVQA
ncbi:hypothetical protein EDC22_103257 [Tepidamorphus gemmatus]|jgi:hypothetical protein|uniref:Uncharacterized protein n=1 Tax=Tepidamorphus gemmatus TaxID=747076 RepID=A0A4R3MDU3_9HYPH|nr:hypothetical protein EDC22_103257 [Tepidamorphus gemmatus]